MQASLPAGWKRSLPAPRQASAVDDAKNGVNALLRSIAMSAGLSFTNGDAMGVSTVFACIKCLADTMAMLPLKIYREGKKGNEQLAGHELTRLLRFPNAEMCEFDFRAAIAANLALYGKAYAVIERDAAGRARSLIPLPTSQVTEERNKGTKELQIRVLNAFTGSQQILPFDRVVHLRSGITFDGINCISASTSLVNVIKLAQAIDTFSTNFFGNGANPGVIIQTTKPLTEDQAAKLRTQIEARMNGGTSRPLVLGEGMDVKTVQLNNQNSQTAEQRKEQDLNICRVFRVPPHKVGIQSTATFGNIEHQGIDFVQTTIGPLCALWEQAFGSLIPSNEQSNTFLKHNLDALLRGDTTSRYAAHAVGRQNGWLSTNDIRRMEDMPDIPGGDSYLEPMNMRQAGDGSTGNPGTQTTRQSRMETNRLNNSMKPLITFPGLELGYQASLRQHYVNLDGKGLSRPSQERAAKIKAEWKNRASEYVASGNENEFPIYNEIGETWDGKGVNAESIRSFLATRSGQDVTFAINSIGGDVFEGVAIYNLIAQHNGKVTMRVDSLAASIATVILMAGDEIEIANNAMLMVHKSWSIVVGNADDMRKEADIMDSIDAGPLLAAYTARTGRSAEELEPILAAETWLTAQEALDGKFVDRILPAKAAPPPPAPEDPAAKAALHQAFQAALNRTAHLKKQLA